MVRLLIILITLLPATLLAQLSCADVFSDHMVLQRNQDIQVWGWAEPQESVTVTFNGITRETMSNQQGKWRLSLSPMHAGGPYEFTVSSERQRISFQDVWIGDVWLCSGQSNMEWPVSAVNNAAAEISAADFPMIRLFDVPHQISLEPREHLASTTKGWQVCTPEHISEFSAVAYFMARELQPKLGVPIGLISSNWGGTIVETWTSKEAISTDPDFSSISMRSVGDEIKAKAKAAIEAQQAFLSGFPEEAEESEEGYLWQGTDYQANGWIATELPGVWEESVAPEYDGSMWYRKTISLSAEQAMSARHLNLGRIDDHDITWINGQEVGRTNGYNDVRKYPIPPGILTAGENVIAIRIMDTGGAGGVWGTADDMFISTASGHILLSGTWFFRPGTPLDQSEHPGIGPNDAPTLLYNGMISPLIPYSITGAIWYQGESNADRASQYQRLFPLMIKDWRTRWGSDFPFLWVQLANYMQPQSEPGESDWAALREAQSMTLSLPRTGQAVIIDIGEADDIHPRNKQDVGKRLALSALHVAYDQSIVHSGPVYSEMSIKEGAAYLTFDQIGSGLVARDKYGYLRGMAIAGEDRQWHWAMATIEGDGLVKVWSPEVPSPVAVRYGWADNPDDVNLYNQEGLPASPFRTDSW